MMIGYKKAYIKGKGKILGIQRLGVPVIVKLHIPDDAKVIGPKDRNNTLCSYTDVQKHRCDKAVVVGIYYLNRSKVPANAIVISQHDTTFTYKVGKKVKPKTFNNHKSVICGGGIHFFIDKQDAVDY